VDASEVERVLANWIAQATAGPGELAPGTDPASWVTQQFLRWWRVQVAEDLSAAESAVSAVRKELGGWSNPEFGEALHELIHASDALGALRSAFGVAGDEQDA
jgi:hypothetical protein